MSAEENGDVQYALQAVAAGKAALSEKPIADTTAIAAACIRRYRAMEAPAPWLVGENWRFLPVFADAAQVVKGRLGKVYKMDLACDIPFTKNTTCTPGTHPPALLPQCICGRQRSPDP